MESRSTSEVSPARSWGTATVVVVVSVTFVLGVLAGVPGFTAFRPGAVETPLGSRAPCMDIGVSGNAAWDRLSDPDYARFTGMTRDLGAGRVRIGANWGEIERVPGVLDWSALDMRIGNAREAGLVPLLVLQSVPDWLTIGVGPASLGGFRDAAAGFAGFAGQVAVRYGDGIEGYEILNEPNLHRFWPDPDAARYFEVLKAAYPAIHAADPDATVITAGLAPAADGPGSIAPMTFLTTLYGLGLREVSDAIGMHPYSYPEPPSGRSEWNTFRSLAEITELMSANGDGDKEIWLTEYGAPTGGLRGVSPEAQADAVVEAFELARAADGLGPIFIYTLVDGHASRMDPEYHFGLYYEDLRPKPAVGALQRAVAEQCAAG